MRVFRTEQNSTEYLLGCMLYRHKPLIQIYNYAILCKLKCETYINVCTCMYNKQKKTTVYLQTAMLL